jgi:hypothetical protein
MGGNAVGGASDTGAAGSGLADLCSEPPQPSPCSALVTNYRHEPSLGLCVATQSGRCDTSPNQFATRDECQAACHGGEPNLDACDDSGDCVLEAADCSGAGDSSGATAFIAVNVDRRQELMALQDCEETDEGLPVAPNQQVKKYLYPACVDGQCTVRDLRERPVTECAVAADCQLRCGAHCCESCTADLGVVAVRAGNSLETELCGGAPAACDNCACVIPEEYSADCVDGRCTAVIGPVCEFGMDQSCNADLFMSSIAGTCNTDGTCTCTPGHPVDPATGRCD